jgi:hypothetical protein
VNFKTALAASRFTGKLLVTVAVGRRDYVGRFMPLGQTDVEARVEVGEAGWTITIENAPVAYTHHSPRLITHVGTFLRDQWVLDELGEARTMQPGNTAHVSVQHTVPKEFLCPASPSPEPS